ncbi:MAG: YifB family Mg chelatase-like AAA ATPase [Lachnospiraceae bacterium]|jgi:magnesium chelatase family protein|nr:YifB family Mg chelatase-like AAA ATPase [Lachnospiraceae bacterium]MCI9470464.1 YifB family Mg chelatase-like AAA ATPase [Lachnospiraceae bacterium]
MFSSVYSAAILGMEVVPVQVEADVSDGLPMFSMVGYVNSQVKETQDRVRTALHNKKLGLPPKRITVNLAPGDVRKEGTGYDLPVALAILTALGRIPEKNLEGVMVVGELGLDGKIKGVWGILPIVHKAREAGYHTCMVPRENEQEGQLIGGIRVVGVDDLQKAVEWLRQDHPRQEGMQEELAEDISSVSDTDHGELDFRDIRGQEGAVRATLIAAAGMHNLLYIGSPGSGKSMLAQRLPGILPPLTREERLEITEIYSIAGSLSKERPVISQRPFRSPHHTISAQALAGGGRSPRPGEITLAHRGVLFMDEFPEFSRRSLEILRQPLEERCIHISRVQGVYTFPADCVLVAAMNPCACGHYPDLDRCRCTPAQVQRYLGKISGPLLDRLDLCVETREPTYEQITGGGESISSARLRGEVMRVQKIQQERYRETKIQFNSQLEGSDVDIYCPMTRGARQWMERIYTGQHLSPRSYHKMLKVSRTIADLDGAETITDAHILEAFGYRVMERKYL